MSFSTRLLVLPIVCSRLMAVDCVSRVVVSSSMPTSVSDWSSMVLPSKKVIRAEELAPVLRRSPDVRFMPTCASVQIVEPVGKTVTLPLRPVRMLNSVETVGVGSVVEGAAAGVHPKAAKASDIARTTTITARFDMVIVD